MLFKITELTQLFEEKMVWSRKGLKTDRSWEALWDKFISNLSILRICLQQWKIWLQENPKSVLFLRNKIGRLMSELRANWTRVSTLKPMKHSSLLIFTPNNVYYRTFLFIETMIRIFNANLMKVCHKKIRQFLISHFCWQNLTCHVLENLNYIRSAIQIMLSFRCT